MLGFRPEIVFQFIAKRVSRNISRCLALTFLVICVNAADINSKSSKNIMNIALSTYEEVKDLPNHPDKYLIDVREPNEIKETGKIPHSINIPLETVYSEFALDAEPDKFKHLYGVTKPNLDSYIIFYCRSGRRSLIAAEAASKMGYRNIHNYLGSWLDWAKREGL